MQFNFAPKMFTFPTKDGDPKTIDRVITYSVPSEQDGQTVKFFICNLGQTVLTLKGVQAVINLVLIPSKANVGKDAAEKERDFIVTLLIDDKLFQGKIELPVGQNFSSKDDFVREDYDYFEYISFEKK